jgi:outer membrane protein assembly factor BamE (lipoprotein component of BamABCDE complex)
VLFFKPMTGIVIILALTLLQGCAFSRGTLGEDIKSESVDAIKKGTTTKAEVLALLGAPDRLIQVNGRDVFQYYRYDAKVGSLLLILINFSRVSIKSDDLFVIVNREGIVEDVILSKRTDGLKFRFWPFGE